MADESDGIEEAFEGTLRVALTAAARAGEQMARAREEAARKAQAESQQRATELAARLDAERDAARASMAVVYRPDWWESAQPDDIARAYQTARGWSEHDPEAVRAEQRIVDELRARYGVDVGEHATDPAAVRDAMDRAERARSDAQVEHGASASDSLDGAALMAQADAVDRLAERAEDERQDRAEETPVERPSSDLQEDARDARERGVAAYDSAERRASMAHDLEGKAEPEVVDARVRADTAQGTPATEATRGTGRAAPRARKTRLAPARQVQRQGPTR